jgi:hypothetical protein
MMGQNSTSYSQVITGAYYYNGSLRIDYFARNGNAPTGWTSPPGYFAKLSADTTVDGYIMSFSLRSSDGKILTFADRDDNDLYVSNAVYRLSSITDRIGEYNHSDVCNCWAGNPT